MVFILKTSNGKFCKVAEVFKAYLAIAPQISVGIFSRRNVGTSVSSLSSFLGGYSNRSCERGILSLRTSSQHVLKSF